MVIGDVLEQIKESIKSLSYGSSVYMLSYPAYYLDGSQVTVAVKLEMETDVVLERDEEQESKALLSTSDEYTIMDLGSVREKFSAVDIIDEIISSVCEKYHIQYINHEIKLSADTQSTLTRLSRYIKCVFEIESRVNDILKKLSDNNVTTNKFMEYLNNKAN